MSNILAVTYDDAVAVTPSDATAQFSSPAAGLIVTAAGTVKLKTARGTTTTLQAAAGIEVHVAFTQIFATGTSATGIVALIAAPYRATT